MRTTKFRGLLASTAVCAAALAWAPQANAQKVITIPDSGNSGGGLVLLTDDSAPAEAKKSGDESKETVNDNEVWIGVMGAPIDEQLRKHLELEDGQGILVADIMAGSPAEKAGIKKHDVLLSAGDSKLNSIEDLIKVVGAAKDKTLKFKVLHKGETKEIEVKPEPRPDRVAEAKAPTPVQPSDSDIQQLMDRIRAGQPMQFRFFNPGMIGHAGFRSDLPDDVSITVKKQGKKPAEIRVDRGDKHWEVTEEALDKLPDDLRGVVGAYLGRVDIGLPQVRGERRELPPGARFDFDAYRRQLGSLNHSDDDLKAIKDRMKALEKATKELKAQMEKLLKSAQEKPSVESPK